jgi:superfamily II DNA or RNA helicase
VTDQQKQNAIQSLARRDLPKDIGLVIIDECHTVGWYQAFEEVKQTYSPCGVPALGKTVYIGLTGSPWRSKPKEHFGEHFEAIVRVPGPESPEDEKKFLTVRLIERGFLVPPRNFGWGGFLRSDLLEKADGEFTQKSLEAAVSHPEFNSHVVKKFLSVATDRSGIVFCASVKQSRELSALFNTAGVRCEHIEADTPHQVRREMYSRLRSGETQLLSWEVLGCKPLSDWETIKASYSRAIERCHDYDDEAKLINLALEKARVR